MARIPWSALAIALLTVTLVAGGLTGCAGRDTETDEDRAVEELYSEAQRQIRRGNYAMGIETLEQLSARFPFGDHAIQAQLMIIYAHHLAEQPESVVAAADRFIRLYPRDENVAYALYMRGLARESMDGGALQRMFGVDRTLRDPEPVRRAFSDYRELVTEYPDSEYVDDANERMERIRDHLARYELYVTDFYLSREAWIAAANRATHVLSSFPGTGHARTAMERLAQAYDGLGLPELAEDVRAERARLDEAPALDEVELDLDADGNGLLEPFDPPGPGEPQPGPEPGPEPAPQPAPTP